MPWMAKSTVHAVLNSDLPFKKPAAPDPAEDEEDPMVLIKKQKKLKKVGVLYTVGICGEGMLIILGQFRVLSIYLHISN